MTTNLSWEEAAAALLSTSDLTTLDSVLVHPRMMVALDSFALPLVSDASLPEDELRLTYTDYSTEALHLPLDSTPSSSYAALRPFFTIEETRLVLDRSWSESMPHARTSPPSSSLPIQCAHAVSALASSRSDAHVTLTLTPHLLARLSHLLPELDADEVRLTSLAAFASDEILLSSSPRIPGSAPVRPARRFLYVAPLDSPDHVEYTHLRSLGFTPEDASLMVERSWSSRLTLDASPSRPSSPRTRLVWDLAEALWREACASRDDALLCEVMLSPQALLALDAEVADLGVSHVSLVPPFAGQEEDIAIRVVNAAGLALALGKTYLVPADASQAEADAYVQLLSDASSRMEDLSTPRRRELFEMVRLSLAS